MRFVVDTPASSNVNERPRFVRTSNVGGTPLLSAATDMEAADAAAKGHISVEKAHTSRVVAVVQDTVS